MKPLPHLVSHQLVHEICGTAVRAAKAAGDIQLAHYKKKNEIRRVDRHDVKLEVDSLCEAAILKAIAARFPQHAIISEESGAHHNGADYLWIVDPLDGSVNFWRQIPYFGSCVACYYTGPAVQRANDASASGLSALGSPVVGVVYAPLMDELFVGIKGMGATCNGKTIATNGERHLADAVISISFGSTETVMKRMQRLCSLLIRRVRKLRILGSTALDIANIASGSLSALLQTGVKNWDFAAARVVLEESGGIFDASEMAPNHWEILACAPGLHPSLRALAQTHEQKEET